MASRERQLRFFRPLLARLLLVAFILSACSQKETVPVDARMAPPCPKVGHAIDLCDGLQVKLISASFFQAIGHTDRIRPQPGRVFALVELEWPQSGDQKGAVAFVDGAGQTWPPHAEAEATWRAMQPGETSPGARDVRVYELPIEAATTGLFLRFHPPCETAQESPHFCLGRHQIVME